MKTKFFATFAVALLFALQLLGTDFRITTTQDTIAPNGLRGAIITANARGGNSTIVLTQSTYHLTIAGADENAGFTGDLDITRGNLTIIGQPRVRGTLVTIDATSLGDRVFHVFPGAHLTLENIAITGGSARGGFYYIGPGIDGENGGGICNEGFLTLNNCIISGNSSGSGGEFGGGGISFPGNGGSGGGICNFGSLTANNCSINNNLCGAGGLGFIQEQLYSGSGGNGGNGGGIFNGGTLRLNNCVVSGNICGAGGNGSFPDYGGNGGNGGSGGGICNTDILVLNYCVVIKNSCGAGGGGGDGSVVGISGNGGNGGSGGGVLNMADASQAYVFSTSIALNSFGAGGDGGDVYKSDPPVPDGNPGSNGISPDLLGGFTSLGFNLVGEADGSSGFVNGIKHDIVGTIAVPANPLRYQFLPRTFH